MLHCKYPIFCSSFLFSIFDTHSKDEDFFWILFFLNILPTRIQSLCTNIMLLKWNLLFLLLASVATGLLLLLLLYVVCYCGYLYVCVKLSLKLVRFVLFVYVHFVLPFFLFLSLSPSNIFFFVWRTEKISLSSNHIHKYYTFTQNSKVPWRIWLNIQIYWKFLVFEFFVCAGVCVYV